MRFEKLQNLGEEKFRKIVNQLIRGTPAQTVARLIQQGWGDAQDVGEDTLARQLKRLYAAIKDGAYGGQSAEEARRTASVRIGLFHDSTVNCLETLAQLVTIQMSRVLALHAKEVSSDTVIPRLNKIVMDCSDLIQALQKIRFDLGLDEYRSEFRPFEDQAA